MAATTVRVATVEDAERLRPLFSALSHPASAAQLRGPLDRMRSDGTYEAWVAEKADVLLGFAAGHLLFPLEDDYPAAQLIALVTDENARGQGIGSALCGAFERWAVDNAAARLMLNSGSDRAAAHEFYLRRGYTLSGRRFSKAI